MNSTLIKRMQGLWVALVVVLAVGAAGATAATAASAATPSAHVSALTKKQKKAKKKAIKKCKKQRNAKKRKACIKKVNKKYKRLAKRNKSTGKTVSVDVRDNFYAPSLVNLKVNDSILWNWRQVAGSEAHNVSLNPPVPKGVSPFGFESQLTSDTSYTFKRKFAKPGTYFFQCSLHTEMRMTVQVKK